MASRIILVPQNRPISPEEREQLEAAEKAHLADLQVRHLHFDFIACSNVAYPLAHRPGAPEETSRRHILQRDG